MGKGFISSFALTFELQSWKSVTFVLKPSNLNSQKQQHTLERALVIEGQSSKQT